MGEETSLPASLILILQPSRSTGMAIDCTRLRFRPWLVLFTVCRHTLGDADLLDGALDLVAGDQIQLCLLLALWPLAVSHLQGVVVSLYCPHLRGMVRSKRE